MDVKSGQNRFTIYANPTEEKGIGYYLDNVIVEEILPDPEDK
jgi:hypothetical protein